MTTSKRKRSGTSRLAPRFRAFLVALLITAPALAEGDRFLFRVGDQVVGARDLGQAADDLTAIGCRFPDSLLLEYLGEGYLVKLRHERDVLAGLKTPLASSVPTTIFLASLRRVWKLLAYVDTQEVTLAPALEKEVLKAKGCPSAEATRGQMRASFRRWLRVEVYLRSRYGQGRPGADAERRDKRFHSIDLFVDSLDKQMSHENFW